MAIKDEVKQIVLEHLRSIDCCPECLADDEKLIDGNRISLDSLDVLNLLFRLESSFDLDLTSISISRDCFENVASLTRFVSQATQSEPGGASYRK